jgi:hypothetical protein
MRDTDSDRFVAPDTVTIDDLKQVQYPEGVHFDIHEEA